MVWRRDRKDNVIEKKGGRRGRCNQRESEAS